MIQNFEFEHFEEELYAKCKEAFASEAYEVTRQDVKKLGSCYHGISIMDTAHGIGMAVDPKELYPKYVCGMSFDELLGMMRSQFDSYPVDPQLSMLTDYNEVKERLFIRISNAKDNAETLMDIPHEIRGEFAITAHALISADEGMASTMITNDLLSAYGVHPKQLISDALKNSSVILPADIIRCPKGSHGSQMYLVTNRMRINGAAVIFYEGVIGQLADLIKKDFYVIPSSVHEMFVWSADQAGSIREMEEVLKEGNERYVAPGEALSEHIYFVSCADRKLIRAES